jgi:hypothetical protein
MYDHYIGLDWAKTNMALARMTRHSSEASVTDVKSDIKELQIYLKSLKGSKILTFEESNPAQWLYTELKDYVDKLVVCDPYRNHLLKEGSKNDKIDAKKLAQLLKADLVKPVFHCTDEFIYLRKLVSGYGDLIKCGVRFKNQRSAMYSARGKSLGEPLENSYEEFVAGGLCEGIKYYEERRQAFEKEFKKAREKFKMIRDLESVPGIGLIGAVKLAAIVVDPKRFKHRNDFLSYCGLIKYELMSGGRIYGRRKPRYCRQLKSVFKTAALACLPERESNNVLRDYYVGLMKEKNYPDHKARHALARRIATLSLGVMKTGEKFNVKKLSIEN